MKKLKINYLLIGVVTLLLAVALWPSIAWLGKAENRVADIQSRGVLRISTINSPLTWNTTNGEPDGLDYELARQFADYLGVKLEVTVRQNVDQLFDDLDSGHADMLAAGLTWNTQRSHSYQPGPTYYYVSQQMVYRMGSPRPRNLGAIKPDQLTLSAGQAVQDDLTRLKESKYPDLSWRTDTRHNSTALLEQVVKGDIDYAIADSVAISIFQRVHPQLAVALDVTDEQPVTWFSRRDGDSSMSAAMLDFFNQINEDGTLARVEEKYLGHVGDFDYVDTRTFLRAIDTVLPDFQPLFQKYAQDIDWRLLAAISYQESHWDPLATSPTGVRGLMMLTRNTALSLGLSDRLDPEQSISGGSRYLKNMMDKVPQTIPDEERIWFALAAYNMGYAHMLDARTLTQRQKGNPDSWSDVKQRLPLLSQKQYYAKTAYGYARGNEAYTYVENIRRYQLSLVGYLLERDKQKTQIAEALNSSPAAVAAANPFAHLPLGPFSQDGAPGKNGSIMSSILPQVSRR